MGSVRSYRDLIVWQKSIDLAKQAYKFTERFPQKEVYGLTSQIRRAAVSIAANIAEGHARESTGEFRQFLGIARGSLAELETLLLLAEEFGYGHPAGIRVLTETCEQTGRLLSGLQKSLAKR
jgi:four helix bundle protein